MVIYRKGLMQLALLFLSFILIFSCSVSNQMQTITKNDNGSTITLSVGETLSIQLTEASTTGYLWEIDQNTLGNNVEILESYTAASTTAAGASGQKIINIRAIRKTQGVLVLKYWQKWENDVQSTFNINVVIH